MFKTTAIDTLKQDKKCQACWYIILSTMSGSTTIKETILNWGDKREQQYKRRKEVFSILKFFP